MIVLIAAVAFCWSLPAAGWLVDRLDDDCRYGKNEHAWKEVRTAKGVPGMCAVTNTATEPPPPWVCTHSQHQPERQWCVCCGAQDHLDFRVSDEVWCAVVPDALDGHVCLRCFDALAAERRIRYAHSLHDVVFVGYRGCFRFEPVSALDASEWAGPA